MSKIDNFRREIKYNSLVFELLAARDVPYLVYHHSGGRTIEAHTPLNGLSILISTKPLPDDKVLVIIKPTGMKGMTEEVPSILLKQKLHKYVGKLL
ncbi:hypothetical protein SEA_YELLOWPANDA_23 [Microbacterium phage YellowPanda]|uniref:Uncharacterized protein n=2 Tax=Tinytimothyvirus tinytimothy TaxID=2845596 RepID=A0A5Q2WLV0_9CAUD|nr:hypothetical protein HWC33_gp22 [Microbacterium phage TinyTimothy]QDF16975.1 hypothetical protein SEA_TINYTIMOTHY_22 [Microbacterium phage TinyTimothy]QGH78663.1 hypothetical protein SEA_WESAK_22 [Microbacterium phage Wesak]